MTPRQHWGNCGHCMPPNGTSYKILDELTLILSIYDSSGFVLDEIIGSLVNQTRVPGVNDATYRLALLVAISKRISGGSIPDLVNIGNAVAGTDPNARFRPVELYSQTGAILLDGTMLLDANDPLNPSEGLSASIESTLEGNIDEIDAPLSVGDAIEQVRAAGVYAKFRVVFLDNASQMTLYTTTSLLLDASSVLDGKQLLDPTEIRLDVAEIALGDGATREPLPGDTGLQNEVYRDTAEPVTINDDEGYRIVINASQLNTYTINEMAAFNTAGEIVLKDRFEGKAKNSSFVYEYTIVENL